MSKDVNKLLKGASDVILASVDDAGAASPAQCGDTFPLLSLDHLDENSIQAETKKLTQREGGRALLQLGDIASVNINSLSGSQNAIGAAKKFKNAQCNIYGFGPQQSHKLTKFLMNVETPNDMKKGGKSVLAFSTEKKISPDETIGTLGSAAAAFAADAAYRYQQIIKQIRQENLVFAYYPYLGNFGQTTKAYDASDARVLGTHYNGVTWEAAPLATYFINTYDGVSRYTNFGDILNDDGESDFLICIWLKVIAADGTLQKIFSKKYSTGVVFPGWELIRGVDNSINFRIADGFTEVSVNGPSTLLQNNWAHIGITVDRNVGLRVYKDGFAGVLSGSISGIATGANAEPLYVGRDGVNYSNCQIAVIEVYKFTAGGLPSTVSDIIVNNRNAQKAILGL